ncbi:MAG: amino acid ABC transporter ATP-binding protein [Terrimicrobiaceae bacterium]|nr:amino acid ABC transporter ATP-binding protein [Terrimicrobiaceae bacterium]
MRIDLHGLTKSFGDHRVLDGVTTTFEFPHTLALIGPSGGGKSTLLRLIAGLDAATAGVIEVDGRPLPNDERSLRDYRRGIGVVFQAYNLFPHLNALENVMLPLVHVHRIPPAEARERALTVLRRFQLEAHAGKQPAMLSGGQRQRVAIARALAPSPSLLLLDEPTSALDPEMTAEVLEVIAELRESDTPIVLVTHEMGFARHTADIVAFVADGGIPFSAPAVEFFGNPGTESVRRFLAKILRY